MTHRTDAYCLVDGMLSNDEAQALSLAAMHDPLVGTYPLAALLVITAVIVLLLLVSARENSVRPQPKRCRCGYWAVYPRKHLIWARVVASSIQNHGFDSRLS